MPAEVRAALKSLCVNRFSAFSLINNDARIRDQHPLRHCKRSDICHGILYGDKERLQKTGPQIPLDYNKGDKLSQDKFKEIIEAYALLAIP